MLVFAYLCLFACLSACSVIYVSVYLYTWLPRFSFWEICELGRPFQHLHSWRNFSITYRPLSGLVTCLDPLQKSITDRVLVALKAFIMYQYCYTCTMYLSQQRIGIGTIVRLIMRRLFKLPRRSAHSTFTDKCRDKHAIRLVFHIILISLVNYHPVYLNICIVDHVWMD